MLDKEVKEINDLWKFIKSKEIIPKTERELSLEQRIIELEKEVKRLKVGRFDDQI